MKKNFTKTLAPQSKSLFRFKNADNKVKTSGNQNAWGGTTTENSDVTITTTIVVTL